MPDVIINSFPHLIIYRPFAAIFARMAAWSSSTVISSGALFGSGATQADDSDFAALSDGDVGSFAVKSAAGLFAVSFSDE